MNGRELNARKDTTMTVSDPRIESQPQTARVLEGKVTIVTGASRGIGAATARAFAGAGAAVVLAARDEQALVAVAAEIISDGGDALVVPTDVSDPASVERLVRRAVKTVGRLDIAFNNAGEGHQPVRLAELAVEDFDRALAVNARGVFLAMKYEIAAMLDSGGGAIVNMTSTAGLRGVKGIAGYDAGKHAIVGLTKSAALDYADQGIRVNAVAPGPIASHRIAQLPEQTRAAIAAAVPLGRPGEPEEVADTVVWLSSDQASFITGAVIPIDGGRLAGGA
jgi:NAD(P)-dependent dehydrogenase (short-subunit alcohol dehydrogenase family)